MIRTWVRHILFLVIVITATGTHAFTQQFSFRKFTTKNGLPNLLVNHIYCDHNGYLWLSTQGGLSRFDGKNFKNYTSREGLPGSDILFTKHDSKNQLWIATNGFGVAVFDGKKFKTISTKDGLGSDIVWAIHEDKHKNIWLATFGGIACWDGKKITNYTTKDGLLVNEYYSITEDKSGNIWFGSNGKGIVKYDGKKFNVNPIISEISNYTVFSLYTDKSGRVWIGTPENGAWIFDNTTFRKLNVPGIENEFISSVREDAYGNFWIATNNQLVKYNEKNHTFYKNANGLSSNSIFSIEIDREGKIWAGTDNGLNVLLTESFFTFTKEDGLSHDNTTCIIQDNDGNLIIGSTNNGLSLYDGNKISPLNLPELENAYVLCLFKNKNGDIYVGLNNSDYGIIILENKKGKYYVKSKIDALNNKNIATVTGITSDKNNSIIYSTFGAGLFIVNGQNTIELSKENKLPSNDILCVYNDSKNRTWFSINNYGVFCYEKNALKNYSTKNGLTDNSVYSICEDKNGNIYFGNYENGITIYNNRTFKNFTTADNLCSNNIQSVLADKENNIWIGTNNGLNRIRFKNDFTIDNIKYYGEANGLKGIEINQNALFVDNNSILWIGSNTGLTGFNPNFDHKNSVSPILSLNEIRLNFQVPDWKQRDCEVNLQTGLPVQPSFAYNENHLTFSFDAITIERVKFTYNLDGLNDEWTPLSEKNEADFTNIPPGFYTLRIKAINSDGIPTDKDYEFSFTIRPPFWQTWWFRISAVVFLLGLIVIIFRWRTAKLAKEKKVLEEKVTQRTQELSVANEQLSHALGDIKDSIHYAQKIQHSILPDEIEFEKLLNHAFVLFKPKDIVSGDFYWITQRENYIIYATCDCTGHGVPGGFMTMLGTSFLNEIINEKGITDPGKVLNEMREKIIEALRQTGAEGENKDGMDMVLCIYDKAKNIMHYAAANNGFYVLRNSELIEIKPEKQPIGFYTNQVPFTGKELALQKGDIIYTFTDGYADQFGGPKGKKFKYKQFEELIKQVAHLPMRDQRELLDQAIMNWMGDIEQNDDILVIGIKIN